MAMTDPTITTATAADAGELLTLQRAAYVTEAQLYREPHLPPLTESLAELRAALAGGGTLVARLAGGSGRRIVGSVRSRLAAGTCHIGRLCVAPDLQGRGIGSALLRAVEAAHAGRADRYALFTGYRSEGNLRLYARLGYVETGRDADPAGITLVHLGKPAPRSADRR